MKKWFIIVGAVVIGLVLLAGTSSYGRNYFYNYKEHRIWNDMQKEIASAKVSNVEVAVTGKRYLKVDAKYKDELLEGLPKAVFSKSNWANFVATPITVIKIKMNDGEKATFDDWGNGIFEVRYHKSRFLINNASLGQVIDTFSNQQQAPIVKVDTVDLGYGPVKLVLPNGWASRNETSTKISFVDDEQIVKGGLALVDYNKNQSLNSSLPKKQQSTRCGKSGNTFGFRKSSDVRNKQPCNRRNQRQ